jgi:hypothetical protein
MDGRLEGANSRCDERLERASESRCEALWLGWGCHDVVISAAIQLGECVARERKGECEEGVDRTVPLFMTAYNRG